MWANQGAAGNRLKHLRIVRKLHQASSFHFRLGEGANAQEFLTQSGWLILPLSSSPLLEDKVSGCGPDGQTCAGADFG